MNAKNQMFDVVVIGAGQAGLANLAVYYLAWTLIGAGMAAGLYDAAFRHGDDYLTTTQMPR